MSDTVLEHPLVRDYLRRLDAACTGLPPAQAQELREQIAAHLDEALPPAATTEQVADELDRLGTPRSVAAGAGALDPRPFSKRLRVRLARIRWWAWAAIVLLVPGLGTGIWFLNSLYSATSLTSMSVDWLYPVDKACSVQSTADEATQYTIPARPGRRQGIEVLLLNSSSYAQTVLGADPQWGLFGGPQVTVQNGPDINPLGVALSGGSTYKPQGAIVPNTARWVDISWVISPAGDLGQGGVIIDSIRLRVRVGVITRTEVITLNNSAMGLFGGIKCGQLPG